MRLANRNAVVIEFPDERQPVVIGPFKSYGAACDRRDKIVEHMEDHFDLADGTDYTIHAIGCHSVDTDFDEIERIFFP